MLAILESPELKEILKKDETLHSIFAYDEKTETVYVSIRNVVDVLDLHGLQLKLERKGTNLILKTAGGCKRDEDGETVCEGRGTDFDY